MRLDMIGLVCQDMAKSIEFYRQLGFAIPDPEPGHPYHEFTLDGGVRISWNDVEMIKKMELDYVEPSGFRMGLAFLCDGVDDVNARYQKLIEAGHPSHKEPFDAFWGQRYAQVIDPDGNVVDLFCWLPES